MINGPTEGQRERATQHEARARNYQQQANLLLERDADTDCAGALLYESAKQCINAVANQRGSNPGTTGGKVNVLRRIAVEVLDSRALLPNWSHADKLHVHADRGHPVGEEFIVSWEATQEFIAAMLTIYSNNA